VTLVRLARREPEDTPLAVAGLDFRVFLMAEEEL